MQNLSDGKSARGVSLGNLFDIEGKLLDSGKVIAETAAAAKDAEGDVSGFVDAWEKIITGNGSGGGNPDTKAVIANKAYWEEQKKNAEAALAAMDVSKKGTAEWIAETKKIVEAQKQLDKYSTKSKSKPADKEDPFTKQLEERKKAYQEYLQWINSGDETLIQAAPIEFAETLKGGNTYLDYLNRLKDDTALTQEQIRAVLNEIAGETDKTVIDMFKESLSEQMSNAKTVIEQLDVIKQMRAGLKDDDPLKVQKEQVLNDADKPAQENLKSEIEELKRQYADYAQQRLDIEKKFNDDLALMYDKNGNLTAGFTQANVDELKRKMTEALSELDMEELTNSDTWNQLFGNLDNLTVSAMIKLRDNIESEWEKLNLSPEQLESLRNKIDEVTKQIEQRNPFLALADAIKKYKSGDKDVNFKDIAKNAAASIDLVSGIFDSVVGGLETMGVEMDESTQKVIKDIGGILDGAGQLAQGIATGNPLAIVQGTISVISNGIDLIAGAKDRKLQKSIDQHLKSVENLKNSYEELERAVDKALGGDVYAAQKAAIDNMRQQQRELYAAADAERTKKKGDESKAAEYENQAKGLGNAIEDTMDDMVNNIISTDAKSIADQLGNSFIDAFAKGEDAAKAWGDSVNDIVAQIVRNMLIQELLQKPIGQILDKYSAKWFDEDDNFMGYDVVRDSIGGLGGELKSLLPDFSGMFNDLPEDIRNTILGNESDADTSLTGAVKGVSEETASMIGGQMNAIRISQMESKEMLRQQLFYLAAIAQNTSYNFHLEKLERIVSLLENSGDSLRSKGLS